MPPFRTLVEKIRLRSRAARKAPLSIALFGVANRALGWCIVGAWLYSGAWSRGWLLACSVPVGALLSWWVVEPTSPRWRGARAALWILAGGTIAHLWSLTWAALGMTVAITAAAFGIFLLTVRLISQRLPPAVVRFAKKSHRVLGTTWRVPQILGTAFLLLPLVRPPEIGEPNLAAKETLIAEGLEPTSPILWLSDASAQAPKGLVLASPRGEPADVYLITFRNSWSGRTTGVAGVYNLSRTGAVEEVGLTTEPGWGAWRVAGGSRTIEVVDFAGEGTPAGSGWGLVGRTQRGLTNLQETGQYRGVTRYQIGHTSTEPKDPRLAHHKLEVEAQKGKRLTWTLGSPEPETTGTEWRWEVIPPARPGSLITWAVDRARALVGADTLQWIKAVVYAFRAEVEDVGQSLAAEEPQEAVLEELGNVRSRLPVLTESIVDLWPPAPIPPVLKSTLPGEGQWTDLTHEPAFSRLTSSAMLFTFIRVDPKRPHHQVSIALWDPRRVNLHIVSGTEEPRSTLGQRGSGLIPRNAATLERVVGAFNGAFQAVHGEFGMVEDRTVILPPKPFAATISTHTDGTTKLGTWPAQQTSLPDDLVGLRQNMTALVAKGQANPYRRHWWGGTPEGWADDSRTVRSAICRTTEGHLAYFYSPSIDPERLAQALLTARCEYGAHLDMNGGHAGFELYRVAPTEKLPRVGRPLDKMWESSGVVAGLPSHSYNARLLVRAMPLMNFPRYIRHTPRDFFYLTERRLLPGPKVGSAQVALKALDLPENDFPPYVVGADDIDDSWEVIRLDAKQLRPVSDAVLVTFAAPPEPAPKGAAVLYWTPRAFTVSKASVDGVPLAHASDAPGSWACIDEGFLTVFTPSANDKLNMKNGKEDGQAKLDHAPCPDPFPLAAQPKLGAQRPGSPPTGSSLGRSGHGLAGKLFPEVPIVSPAVWGVPQSRRVQWTTTP